MLCNSLSSGNGGRRSRIDPQRRAITYGTVPRRTQTPLYRLFRRRPRPPAATCPSCPEHLGDPVGKPPSPPSTPAWGTTPTEASERSLLAAISLSRSPLTHASRL